VPFGCDKLSAIMEPPLRRDQPAEPFTWRDGERLVRFGRGALAEAPALVPGPYALLTTPRARAAAPALVAGAAEVHEVPAGLVDDVSAALRGAASAPVLVALGGGRVIDVAKAIAAADPPRRVVAVPTTLSAAEMTATHRLPAGVSPETPRVRPAVVVNDPALSASQPEPGLVASAMNALGHAVEAPLTPWANPVATMAAERAMRLILGALEGPDPDRDALALGALLAGYAMDSTGYGLHHVMSQTLVRVAGVGHGPANAAMLPHTIPALAARFPAAAAGLERVRAGAARLAPRAGAARLRDLGVDRGRIGLLAARAAERPELAQTPPAAGAGELAAIYEAAW
jgi:alcohol dehydrogenase class IV